MPVKCLYFCFVVLLTLNGESHGHPPEPCATFALKNGRVEFALHKNGRPVANATIQIIDEKGAKFGDGDTGAEGQTAFPLPPGSSFVVEIKAGERTADPIRLFKSTTGVEPARVLLSYGLRPCCRSIKSARSTVVVANETEAPAAEEHSTFGRLWAPAVVGVLVFAIGMFLLWRRCCHIGELASGSKHDG